MAVAFLHAASAPAASRATDYQTIMRLTIDGWVASQSSTGFLPYDFNFLADKAVEAQAMSRPQFIHQVLSAYTLAKYYEYSNDSRLQEPIRRALSTYGTHSLPISKGHAQRWIERTRILSLPIGRWKLQSTLDRLGLLYQTSGSGSVLSPDGTYRSAAPGAVALAILTELTFSRAARDDRFAGWRSAWMEGLLSLHVPGGGFRQTADSIDDADYYSNGEAWLALAVYSDVHRDDGRTTRILAEVDEALMERYSEKPNPNFYHWGAMAAAQRLKTTGEPRFLTFLQEQATLFFERFERTITPDDNNCASMEGLAATLAALNYAGERKTALAERITSWLATEREKLPRLQIQPGQQGMQLGGDAYLRAPRLAEFAGAFLGGLYEPSARLDAGAHCLSAMIMLDREGLLSPK